MTGLIEAQNIIINGDNFAMTGTGPPAAPIGNHIIFTQ